MQTNNDQFPLATLNSISLYGCH